MIKTNWATSLVNVIRKGRGHLFFLFRKMSNVGKGHASNLGKNNRDGFGGREGGLLVRQPPFTIRSSTTEERSGVIHQERRGGFKGKRRQSIS